MCRGGIVLHGTSSRQSPVGPTNVLIVFRLWRIDLSKEATSLQTTYIAGDCPTDPKRTCLTGGAHTWLLPYRRGPLNVRVYAAGFVRYVSQPPEIRTYLSFLRATFVIEEVFLLFCSTWEHFNDAVCCVVLYAARRHHVDV